jgi:hypothetical protein
VEQCEEAGVKGQEKVWFWKVRGIGMKTTILLVGILGLLMLVALPASAENIGNVFSGCHIA